MVNAFQEFVFEGMGKGAMADIVQQDGYFGGYFFFGVISTPLFFSSCSALHMRW